MEIARHERAIVVVSSYVIGFTSAFIAFGLSSAAEEQVVVLHQQSPAREFAMETKSHTASIHIEADGLVVTTEKGERLLSVRKSSPLAASVIAGTAVPGFAERIIEAELSRDSRFVYFCELLTVTADTCDAYVYDIETDVLYPVEQNETNVRPIIANHNSYWLDSGLLKIGDLVSISPETPWFVR